MRERIEESSVKKNSIKRKHELISSRFCFIFRTVFLLQKQKENFSILTFVYLYLLLFRAIYRHSYISLQFTKGRRIMKKLTWRPNWVLYALRYVHFISTFLYQVTNMFTYNMLYVLRSFLKNILSLITVILKTEKHYIQRSVKYSDKTALIIPGRSYLKANVHVDSLLHIVRCANRSTPELAVEINRHI